jgi:hypothetical protein
MIMLLWLGISTEMSSQDNSFTFSINKDPLESFKTNYGGYLKHNWGLSKSWYLSSGIGFWIDELYVEFTRDGGTRLRDNSITIFPENDFALQEVIEATDGKVGYAQRVPTNTGADIHVPLFLNFGRKWLRRSEKFSLNTDIGFLASYFHSDLYGWADQIAIQSGIVVENPAQANEFGDPVYWLAGKAIRRSIEFGVSINLETTYHIDPRVGVGVNVFMGGYFNYLGYSLVGIHFQYSY